jgi:hypothetical protein
MKQQDILLLWEQGNPVCFSAYWMDHDGSLLRWAEKAEIEKLSTERKLILVEDFKNKPIIALLFIK